MKHKEIYQEQYYRKKLLKYIIKETNRIKRFIHEYMSKSKEQYNHKDEKSPKKKKQDYLNKKKRGKEDKRN